MRVSLHLIESKMASESFHSCDEDVFASQKRIIVDPQSTGYPIPYLIDSGKVEKISVYASTYMEHVKILS